MSKETLMIVPARKGSKGIPGKNLKKIAGKSLIQWIAEAASASKWITYQHCSTDCIEIAKEARNCGLNCTPLRNNDLAQDDSKVLDVIKSCVTDIEKLTQRSFDAVILLQCTSPFVSTDNIDDALSNLYEGTFDTVISAVEAESNHPNFMFQSPDGKSVDWTTPNREYLAARRQDLDQYYLRVGNLYAFKKDNLARYNSIYGRKVGFIKVEKSRSVTIDTPLDLQWAQFLGEQTND